jgi:hypothetical protein
MDENNSNLYIRIAQLERFDFFIIFMFLFLIIHIIFIVTVEIEVNLNIYPKIHYLFQIECAIKMKLEDVSIINLKMELKLILYLL